MFNLKTDKSSYLHTENINISVETDTDIDYWNLFYTIYPATSFLPIITNLNPSVVYSYKPIFETGTITFKAVGIKKLNNKTILLAFEDEIKLLFPTTIDSTTEVLGGVETAIKTLSNPITAVRFTKDGKIVYTESRNYKKYRVGSDRYLTVYEGDRFYEKLTLSEEVLDYLVPVLEENYDQYLVVIDRSGKEFERYKVPKKSESALDSKIKIYQDSYIPISVDTPADNFEYIYSEKIKDDISFITTDKDGKFTTGRKYRPGYIAMSLGKKSEDASNSDTNMDLFVSDYLFYTEKDNKNEILRKKVVEQTDIPYVLSGISMGFHFTDDVSDGGCDFTVPINRLIGKGKITVQVFDDNLDFFPNVQVTGSGIGITDISGICVFNNLPICSYVFTPSLDHYLFTPIVTTAGFTYPELASSVTEKVIQFIGTKYFTLGGSISDQNNQPIRDEVAFNIVDRFSQEKDTFNENSFWSGVGIYFPSNYSIYVTPPSDRVLITPKEYLYSIVNDDVSGLDFRTTTYSISGKCYDVDAYQASGIGISGMSINLYTGFIKPTSEYEIDEIENVTPFLTETTNASGLFVISRLLPGDYTLRAEKSMIDIERGISFIKRTMHIEEDSIFILTLRESFAMDGESAFLNLITSYRDEAISSGDMQTAISLTMLLSKFEKKVYFSPEQRTVTLYDRDYGGQDFFTEPLYSIEGKFIDENNNDVSGIDYMILSDNRRSVFNNVIKKVNGRDFSYEVKGEVTRDTSENDGYFGMFGLLKGSYTIIPQKKVETWQEVTDAQTLETTWQWVSEQDDPFNFGYTFRPSSKDIYINKSYSGLSISAYTSSVSGIVVDSVTGKGIQGVKLEIVGGEYMHEIVEVETDAGTSSVVMEIPKQTNSLMSGIYFFEKQLPETQYDIYPFKEVTGISVSDFYSYAPPKGNIIPDLSALPVSLQVYQDFVATKYPKYTITGIVLDELGGAINTDVGAVDGNQEAPSIKLGWKKEQLQSAGSDKPFEIPKYVFSSGVNSTGGYTIVTGMPESYTVLPGRNSFSYTPESVWNPSITGDISGINFVGSYVATPPQPPSSSGVSIDFSQYYISGRVSNIKNGNGISGIDVLAIEKTLYVNPGGTNQKSVKTDIDGVFMFDGLYPGLYHIAPENIQETHSVNYKDESIYFYHPDVPYQISLYDRNYSGIDFDALQKIKIEGFVHLVDTSGIVVGGIPNVSIFTNTGHSRINYLTSGFSVSHTYEKDLYYPFINYNYDGTIAVANQYGHNVQVINIHTGEELLMYGNSGINAEPGKPRIGVNFLSYPESVIKLPNDHLIVSEFGGNKITEIRNDSPAWSSDSIIKVFSFLDNVTYSKYFSTDFYSEDYLVKTVVNMRTNLIDKSIDLDNILNVLYNPYNDFANYFITFTQRTELFVDKGNKDLLQKIKYGYKVLGLNYFDGNTTFTNTYAKKLISIDDYNKPLYISGVGLASVVVKTLKVLINGKWHIVEDGETILLG